MQPTIEKPTTPGESNALILTGDGYGLTISPDAEALKARLIKDAQLIVEVTTPDDAAATRIQAAKLADMRIAIEKCRVKVKAPAIEFGRQTDAKATEFVAAVKAEEDRLNKLMAAYGEIVERERRKIAADMEKQRLAEAEALRKAEADRIAAERAAEAARIAAEKAAAAAEADRWGEGSNVDAEAAKAEARAKEAARLKAEEESAAAMARAVEMAKTRTSVFVPEKVAGVKMEPDFEILDIHAVYRANPNMCDLTAKRAAILAAIKLGTVNGVLPSFPGMRVFERAQARSK